MKNDVEKQLKEELHKYLQSSVDFPPYYPGMKTLSSSLYKKQLLEAKELIKNHSDIEPHNFELYLDTIIINMHTKIKKYKKSIYFDDENIKDIQNQGFTIPFYVDREKDLYILLGIVPIQAS
jgi:hypothetical protein